MKHAIDTNKILEFHQAVRIHLNREPSIELGEYRKINHCLDIGVSPEITATYLNQTVSTNMCCPYCGNKIRRGDDLRYETLIEHGINPNKETYPKRLSFICECSPGMFWSPSGYSYISNFETLRQLDRRQNKPAKRSFANRRRLQTSKYIKFLPYKIAKLIAKTLNNIGI